MSSFEVIPAIDLLGGRCVRLSQGDYDRVSVYGEDPGAVAEGFVRIGAQRVHTVDLDGARAGTPHNRDAVRAIVAAAKGVPVQLGGGMRSLAAIDAALALGIERAI
ncbi:MAG: 1-(5-phosphoribosyl)-5-((5-phosphoribosylamino)methylideneamino)imidazole-4-carboxamide isomerase, partial [Methylococcaceae bacterium]|nr:1-(5-phosphoribosyl)-5-((5-phosphoribosylamino)methylideneamino)imidazole-4-carboxamide isomerase [Methylococcaceae bacterium]